MHPSAFLRVCNNKVITEVFSKTQAKKKGLGETLPVHHSKMALDINFQ